MMKKENLFHIPLEKDCSLKQVLEPLDVAVLQEMLLLLHNKREEPEDKATLVQMLTEQLPIAIQRFVLCFDTERYQLLQTVLAQEGVIEGGGFSTHKILALREMGLLFPALQDGRQVLVMPLEIRDLLAEMDKELWKEVAECNTRILQRASGLLCYYGFLETNTLFRLCLYKEPEETWDIVYFMELLYASILYYDNIEPEEDGFRHKQFWNYTYVYNQQKKLKQIPDYKVFSAEILEQAGKKNRIEWTLPMERLKQFLVKEGHLTKNAAKREVETVWYELNNGIPLSDVCEHLLSWYFSFSAEDKREVLNFYLLQMFCAMPLWLLNGYSFSELGQIEEIVSL